jgi:hypothetical protein
MHEPLNLVPFSGTDDKLQATAIEIMTKADASLFI